MRYETVIGIETHCELRTKIKMSLEAPTLFGEVVNTYVNGVDLGHPGTLPCVSRDIARPATLVATTLKCEIDPLVKFDRKNYYCSDPPKGFQITQQFHPIGSNGVITTKTDDGERGIHINRIHMEGDTAKQFRSDTGILVDYNHAEALLVEIVNGPDTRNGAEAAVYVEKLGGMLYYLEVSGVKVEEGSMRCDVDVSICPQGSEALGTKTEVKSLGSISNVQETTDAGVVRQRELSENGEEVV